MLSLGLDNTMATALYTNSNTGETVSVDFYSPGEDYDATGSDVAWVIESPPEANLANFGTINFDECYATDNKGTRHDLTGGRDLWLVRQGTHIASGTIVGSSEVSISYVPS